MWRAASQKRERLDVLTKRHPPTPSRGANRICGGLDGQTTAVADSARLLRQHDTLRCSTGLAMRAHRLVALEAAIADGATEAAAARISPSWVTVISRGGSSGWYVAPIG